VYTVYMTKKLPLIDIFAGPGGLGEGFASLETDGGDSAFDIRLSVESDKHAYETLVLRNFFREFKRKQVPMEYYDVLRGLITKEKLYDKYPKEAKNASSKVWKAILGNVAPKKVRERVQSALGGSENWVLIGGPPCQAYSLAGRSRNRKKIGYVPEEDARQRLYLEFLQIIADFWPPVFIMENVKGLLSATLNNSRIFQRIVEDVGSPANALRREERVRRRNGRRHKYRIFSMVTGKEVNGQLSDALLRAENYGIPQARHRVILMGIRDDLGTINPESLEPRPPVEASKVLYDLPKVRSGLSKMDDNADAWIKNIRACLQKQWFSRMCKSSEKELWQYVMQVVKELVPPEYDRGGEFLPVHAYPDYAPEWFFDPRLQGICNYSTRGHIPQDLHRYLYATCFAKIHSRSPLLKDFPSDLHPAHNNVKEALQSGNFSDRFRVQVADKPATTITSHISKDGHYYIHPDPLQCRSLTVREAARIQTFPDNYFFMGPRTFQYVQVGNAVPPMLARQIAKIVHKVLIESY